MCYSRVLAGFHTPDLRDPQQLQGLALPKTSSRMSQAWEISLREQGVDVRLLSISCSVVSLHRLPFSDVPQSCFQARDLRHSQQLQGFPSLKCLRGCLTRGNFFTCIVRGCEIVVDIM